MSICRFLHFIYPPFLSTSLGLTVVCMVCSWVLFYLSFVIIFLVFYAHIFSFFCMSNQIILVYFSQFGSVFFHLEFSLNVFNFSTISVLACHVELFMFPGCIPDCRQSKTNGGNRYSEETENFQWCEWLEQRRRSLVRNNKGKSSTVCVCVCSTPILRKFLFYMQIMPFSFIGH